MELIVNQKVQTFSGDPETPLLWFLRDHLKLSDTRFGCGQGLCGACSAHIDGKLARTCSTSCNDVQGQEITTISGLSPKLAEVIKNAWIAVDVPQCGYCQNGMMMAAAALLAKNPSPNDDEITEAMNKNICRCGTYARIRKAIHLAATNLSSKNA